jgi:hypothetical protein
MKYKKKFNAVITLILFFTILTSIFTIPLIIQAGHYATAALSVCGLLFVTFAAGYKVACQDKDDRTEILVECIRSRVTHVVSSNLSEENASKGIDDMKNELYKKIRKSIDQQVDNYFNID